MIHEFPEGVLLGVADGLGHGPDAAAASRLCASILAEYAGEPLGDIVTRCHARLRGTRGVALLVCTLNERARVWSWIGIGDVSGVLVRTGAGRGRNQEFLLQRGGVVGGAMPRLAVATVPASPGDVLILATDGVRADFSDELDPRGAPQKIAERILNRHATGRDDALALVGRYAVGSL